MNRSMSVGAWLAAATLMGVWSQGLGQDGPSVPEAPELQATDAEPGVVREPSDEKPLRVKSPYRYLAPGVLISIDPMRTLKETVSRHDLNGLLAIDPAFDWAKDVAFHHDVWVLKFQFKPMRILWVDVPQPSGMMQRKPIWYMVYVVTNTGEVMHPVQDKPLPYETHEKKELFEVRMVDQPVRFAPEFLLEGHQHMDDSGFTKVYPDRVIPVAMKPIRLREDPARKFLTSVEMCREIGVGKSFWGVATWEDIDPRIVRFSVYVFGLTNAYQWQDVPSDQQEPADPLAGRRRYQKALKLNFWRPADPYDEHEKEIRYGVPDGVDYQWVYR